jgi:hypothetical protein
VKRTARPASPAARAGASGGGRRRDWRVPAAIAVLITGLAVGWVTDFRYVTIRSLPSWEPTAVHWAAECERGPVTITVPGQRGWPTPIPCANVHP